LLLSGSGCGGRLALPEEDQAWGKLGDSHYKAAGEPFVRLEIGDNPDGKLHLSASPWRGGDFPPDWTFTATIGNMLSDPTVLTADGGFNATFLDTITTTPGSLRIELDRPGRDTTVYEIDVPPKPPAPALDSTTAKLGTTLDVRLARVAFVPAPCGYKSDDAMVWMDAYAPCTRVDVGFGPSPTDCPVQVDMPLASDDAASGQTLRLSAAAFDWAEPTDFPCGGPIGYGVSVERGYTDGVIVVARSANTQLTFTN
jgi:hypothetical protein